MKKLDKLNLKKKLLLAALTVAIPVSYENVTVKPVEASSIATNDMDTKLKSTDEQISYYSRVFNLKTNLVRSKLSELTNNFSSYEWNNFNIMNNMAYDSKEEAILLTIQDMFYNPEDYGYTKAELKSLDDHVVTLTPEEMVYRYANVVNINKDVALSIVYSECGVDVNSYNYRKRNNPAGIGPHMTFENKEVGFIYFVNLLKNSYNCTIESDEEFFDNVAKYYCTANPDHWVNMAQSLYDDIVDDYYCYSDGQEKTKILE